MNESQNSPAQSSRKTLVVALMVIGIGMVFHMILFRIFGNRYLAQISLLADNANYLSTTVPVFLKKAAGEIYAYLGVFFLPLIWFIARSTWYRLRFIHADIKSTPFSPAQCRLMYGRAEYIGITQASLVGILGTVSYLMVGLGLMAEPMVQIAEGLQDNGNVLKSLPGAFKVMGEAAMKLVPALGTTAAAIVSELLVVGIPRLCEKWHGGGWQKAQLSITAERRCQHER